MMSEGPGDCFHGLSSRERPPWCPGPLCGSELLSGMPAVCALHLAMARAASGREKAPILP